MAKCARLLLLPCCLVVCIVLLLCAIAVAAAEAPQRAAGGRPLELRAGGGARPRPSAGGALPAPPARRRLAARAPDAHVVVDTLNLAHYLFTTSKKAVQLTTAVITATVARTAGALKKRFPGRVVYVVKDKDSAFNAPETRAAYAATAKEFAVSIAVVENYEDPPGRPPSGSKRSAPHSARGRDDFYTAILARKLRCGVLTEDRFRDFDEFRATVAPFHVLEYTYWKDVPDREYIDPRSPGYRGLKRPHAIRYAEVLADVPKGVAPEPDGGAPAAPAAP